MKIYLYLIYIFKIQSIKRLYFKYIYLKLGKCFICHTHRNTLLKKNLRWRNLAKNELIALVWFTPLSHMTWFDFISSAITQPQGHRMWWENSLSESQSITARRLKHSLAVKMSRESGTHSAFLVFGQLQGLRERGLKVAYLISIQDGSHMQSVSVVVVCGIRNENGGPAAFQRIFFIIYPNHLPTHFSSYIKFSTMTRSYISHTDIETEQPGMPEPWPAPVRDITFNLPHVQKACRWVCEQCNLLTIKNLHI